MKEQITCRPFFILMTFLTFGIIVSTSFTTTDDCKRLRDGQYKVKFKRFPKSDYSLIIQKNEFTKKDKEGRQTRGTIEWNGDCYFILSSDTVTMGNPLTKKIVRGMGNPCYELAKTKARATSFRLTYSGNLNITIAEGTLIKVD